MPTSDGLITTEGGLLLKDGRVISLPEADKVAKRYGFMYAEQMVKSLEEEEKDADI